MARKKLEELAVKKPTKAEWTEGRLKSFITSVLRGGYRRYPPKFETLKEALVGKQINKNTGRLAAHYRCNECKGVYPAKEVNVDHIIPVVGVGGFRDWDTFIKRLFCSKDNLQVLCSTCHNRKSNEEKQQRKNNVGSKNS